MRNRVIQIDKEKIKGKADKYFFQICDDSIEGEQKEAFLEEIKRAEQHVLNHMIPQVICSYYSTKREEEAVQSCGEVSFHNDMVSFYEYDDFQSEVPASFATNCFHGGIFRYYGSSNVKGIIVYLLTVGSLHKRDDMKLLEQYYIDAWGSAYVEAAHDLLKMELISSLNAQNDWEERDHISKCFVSEPFGPGYFGIDVKATKDIFNMLENEKLNLTISDGGMMQPEKSCSGFYVITENEIPFPDDNCAFCIATVNCEYCRKKHV